MPRTVTGIRREHVEAYLATAPTEKSAATAATYHAALRRVFGWLVEEGELKASPMQHVRSPHIPEAPPPVLSDDQLKRLLKTCEGKDFMSRRDQAILRLLMDTGMRRAECAGLRVDDIDFDGNVAYVIAKGRRPR